MEGGKEGEQRRERGRKEGRGEGGRKKGKRREGKRREEEMKRKRRKKKPCSIGFQNNLVRTVAGVSHRKAFG